MADSGDSILCGCTWIVQGKTNFNIFHVPSNSGNTGEWIVIWHLLIRSLKDSSGLNLKWSHEHFYNDFLLYFFFFSFDKYKTGAFVNKDSLNRNEKNCAESHLESTILIGIII